MIRLTLAALDSSIAMALPKNTAHVITLFALSNLWMARKQLMPMMGAVRRKAA